MLLDLEEYRIISDERQFIVQKKKFIQDSKFTKKENIGKKYYIDIAYCSTLNYSLKTIVNKTLLEHDDLKIIQKKLSIIEDKIEKFTRLIENPACIK